MSLRSMSTEKSVSAKSIEALGSEASKFNDIISLKFLNNLEGVSMLQSLGPELQEKVGDLLLKWKDISPTDLLNPTTLKELREDISAIISDNGKKLTFDAIKPFDEFDGGFDTDGED